MRTRQSRCTGRVPPQKTEGTGNRKTEPPTERSGCKNACPVAKGIPTPAHRTHTQWVAGLGHTQEGRTFGRGRVYDPRHPSGRHQAPYTERPGANPTARMPARKSVRCGVGGGSPRPQTPAPSEKGQRAPAACPKDGSGRGENVRCPRPLTDARGAPQRSLWCRLAARKASSRAYAVGLVRGPEARNPRAHGKGAVGPGRLLQGRAVGGGRVPNPRPPSKGHGAPLSGRPRAAPAARRAASRELMLWDR